MRWQAFVAILLIVCGRFNVDTAHILGIFIHPAISHFRAFRPVLLALANKGHDVYVVSHFPEKNPPPANYHEFVLKQDDILTGKMPVDEVRHLFYYYFIMSLKDDHKCYCFAQTKNMKCLDTESYRIIL